MLCIDIKVTYIQSMDGARTKDFDYQSIKDNLHARGIDDQQSINLIVKIGELQNLPDSTWERIERESLSKEELKEIYEKSR